MERAFDSEPPASPAGLGAGAWTMSGKASLPIETDELGRIRLGGIHDAQLVEMRHRPGRDLVFRLAGADDGRLTDFTLSGIHVLTLTEVWEGCIVDDVLVWAAGAVPEDTWANGASGWNPLLRGRIASPDGCRREAARLAALHPSSLLLVVTCNYGGGWSALCDRLEVTRA